MLKLPDMRKALGVLFYLAFCMMCVRLSAMSNDRIFTSGWFPRDLGLVFAWALGMAASFWPRGG